ncbi:MAG: hypothetical protein U1F43_39050 [Myxococcota bacterium]
MNGFTQMQQDALAGMKKAFDEQVARFGSMAGKAGEKASEIEQATTAQVTTAVDEWARLMKTAFTWQAEMAAAWRKQAIEAVGAWAAFLPQPPKA